MDSPFSIRAFANCPPELWQASIGATYFKLLMQLAEASVQHWHAFANGLMPKGTGQPGLPHSRRACNDEVLLTDPVTVEPIAELPLVQPTLCSEVDILWSGRHLKPRQLEQPGHAAALAPRDFGVDEHGKPVLEGQILNAAARAQAGSAG
nr:hypothetical protein [Roseateles puraquae]